MSLWHTAFCNLNTTHYCPVSLHENPPRKGVSWLWNETSLAIRTHAAYPKSFLKYVAWCMQLSDIRYHTDKNSSFSSFSTLSPRLLAFLSLLSNHIQIIFFSPVRSSSFHNWINHQFSSMFVTKSGTLMNQYVKSFLSWPISSEWYLAFS